MITKEVLTKALEDDKVIFVRSQSGWDVFGRATTVKTGETVTVTKASGETRTVTITGVWTSKTDPATGIDYAQAAFTDTIAASESIPRTYRTKHSSIYGTGRVYHDQPGATQYDDGTGRYSVQIWDEA